MYANLSSRVCIQDVGIRQRLSMPVRELASGSDSRKIGIGPFLTSSAFSVKIPGSSRSVATEPGTSRSARLGESTMQPRSRDFFLDFLQKGGVMSALPQSS